VSNVTPAHRAHVELVSDVQAWLEDKRFFVTSLAYHDRMGEDSEEAKRLGAMWDPTAIVVRHRPDRIAFHSKLELAFWGEAKTKSERFTTRQDVNIDLCTIIATWTPDPEQRVLFVHRNQHIGWDIGIWVADIPPLCSEVRIDRRKWGSGRIADWYEGQARRIFGTGVRIEPHTGGGSGDPYVVIPAANATQQPHWKDAVTAYAKAAKATGSALASSRRHTAPTSSVNVNR
jgi:hypothetical protein